MKLQLRSKLKKALFWCAPRAANRYSLFVNRRKYGSIRKLEIGPGTEIINGFERLSVIYTDSIDYVEDATLLSSIPSNTFDKVYASHVLEHIPWHKTLDALRNWNRILKPSGHLDIWVPDGEKIAQAYLDGIKGRNNDFLFDNWDKFNSERSPSVWFNGRIFSYGDGTGANLGHPNWHRASFDIAYLIELLRKANFSRIQRISHDEILGHDHGWINLGVRAFKHDPASNV